MLNQDNLHLISLSILITCLLDMYWYYLEKLHVKHLLEFFFFLDRQLRYVGQSEMGDKSRSTLLRSCVEVSTSDNLTTFLKELGFRWVILLFLSWFIFFVNIQQFSSKLSCTLNVNSFSGFNRYESEFVLKGYYFIKGHMRITVSQVCRVSNCLLLREWAFKL